MKAVEGSTIASRNALEHDGGDRPRLLRRFHRIATVRRQQGVSLRAAARRLGTTVAELTQRHRNTTDLRLSDLYDWQRILEVPIVDLLVDPGTPLSRPIQRRAQLIRLMKSANAVKSRASSRAIAALAQTMVDQLIEIMPELREVAAPCRKTP